MTLKGMLGFSSGLRCQATGILITQTKAQSRRGLRYPIYVSEASL